MMKNEKNKYAPYYFKINGVEIYYKSYDKENKIIHFYTQDGKIHATISKCENNYSWEKCERLFGDK